MTEPLLRVESLKKYFPVTRGVLGKTVDYVRAVDDVSFEIAPGETLGLVGESGCGKSTVGRTVLHLNPPTAGDVWFDGKNIAHLSAKELQRVRRDMQIVFQDPFSSLNPRMRVFDIVGEALAVHGLARGQELRQRVLSLLGKVGVSPRWADRYAHEFSGGQRQRIGIARAIAMNPKLVVCDEAVSALDVSIQAQIINLLLRLREELGLSYLFISHDLSVVRHISHRVMVMYLGQLVELASTPELFRQPAHPYTRALLSAVPVADPRHLVRRVILHGDVPTPINPPSGCRFHTRCPVAFERCSREEPQLYSVGVSPRTVKCFHAEGLTDDNDWYAKLVARFEPYERSRAGSARTSSGSEAPPEPSAAAPREDRSYGSIPESGGASEVIRAVPAPPASAVVVSPAARRPARAAWAVALGAVVLGVALSAAQNSRREAQARREIAGLRTELSGYAQSTGNYPVSLSKLGYRLGFVFGRDTATDPWGHAYQYSRDKGPAPGFELYSLGPDGQPSADDIR